MSDKEKTNWFKKHKVLTAILVLIALVVIGSAAGGSNTSKPTTNSPDAKTPSTEAVKEEKWDVADAYKKVKNGMTKKQVETATKKESKDCVESQIEGIGTSETCNYGDFSDNGQIIVTYDNGKVSSKTKSNF